MRKTLFKVAGALLALTLSASAAAQSMPQLRGLVVSSSDETLTGLYALPPAEGGAWDMLIGINPGYSTIYTGIFNPVDDAYYVTRCNAQYGTPIIYLDSYDMETGNKNWTVYPQQRQFLAYDLAVNPFDGKTYGIFSNANGSGMILGTAHYAQTGYAITTIAEMEGNWVAIAADAAGQLYGIKSELDMTDPVNPVVLSSALYTLDRFTGAATLIGETGMKPLLLGSATIDIRSGRMFWTVGEAGQPTCLCEVNLLTGAATKLFDFEGNRQVTGLYAVAPLAEDNAPALVSNAVASFEGGSLTGTISFTAPTTLFDGTPASGALSYSILANGVQAASGITSYGSDVTAPVTVTASGEYSFVITVSNENGTSPNAEIKKFVGFGKPAAPANVNATLDGSSITVTWDAVTTTLDGGYIAPADVRYTVTRKSDNQVVASSISATSVTIDAGDTEGLTSTSFEVKADNGGVISDAAESNTVVIGHAQLPWTESFDSADAFNFLTVIDANNDGYCWFYNNGIARIRYNSSKAMDDWLITPAIYLEAGNSYRVSFKAHSSNARYQETVEAKWGNAATVAGMTNALISATTLPGDYTTLEGVMEPTVSGLYYVGIHGISERDKMYLEIDDISIEAGLNVQAPAAPEAFTVTPDANGLYKATVSVTAPAVNQQGAQLSALTSVVIKRGETVVHTFANPAPGSVLTFEDSPAHGGEYVYTAYATNEHGDGVAVTATVLVGTPLTVAPASASFTEPQPGTVTVSWQQVTKSAAGADINPANVRYNVYSVASSGNTLVAERVEGTSTTLTGVVADGQQQFLKYAVSAVTEGGESEDVQTPSLPVGTPYAGYSDSFAGGDPAGIYEFERINYGNWMARTDSYGVAAQDNDNGLMVMTGYFSSYMGALNTGKINLDGIAAPVLSFYSYTPDNAGADVNTLEVLARTPGGEWTPLMSKTVVELGATQGWHEVNVPISAFAGQVVQFRFVATIADRNYTDVYIDNLNVVSLQGIDLSVGNVSAPSYVRTGDAYTIAATVRNDGASAAENYSLELRRGDETVASLDGLTLAGAASAQVEMELTMSPFEETAADYTLVAVHPDDTRADNDASAPFRMTPVLSQQPAPEYLEARQNGNAVVLNWTAPQLATTAPEPLTDDVEEAEQWAHNAPGWIFIDRDDKPVVGFGEMEIPGITAGSTTAAFIVFNTAGSFNGNTYLMPHSGNQYLAALARFDNGTTDDWAISPELSADAQTVSFYAKSYHASYPERIEVYYSTGSLNPDDFVSAGLTVESLPADWTKYEVALPAGARYFAIRSCATNSFMLMLDDITYRPASSHNLTLAGYNVYRDGLRVNDGLVATPSYLDYPEVDDSAIVNWAVTAVYNNGESRPSNTATVTVTGIDGVTTDVVIRATGGEIRISGAAGEQVTVTTAAGLTIYRGVAGDELRIPAAAGNVYIIAVGSKSAKVLLND